MISLLQRINSLPASAVKNMRDTVITNTGTSRASYYRFVNQTTKHNLKIAVAMADFLGCSVQQLLDDSYDLAKHYAAKTADGKAVVA